MALVNSTLPPNSSQRLLLSGPKMCIRDRAITGRPGDLLPPVDWDQLRSEIRKFYPNYEDCLLYTSFITKSGLGTSQISSLPYVLSLRFPLSFGGFTFIMNTVFILIQIAIQRRNFPPVQLLQIAANVLFSAFLDVSMAALNWLHPAGWLARGGCMLLGCAILACGISIEIAPDRCV